MAKQHTRSQRVADLIQTILAKTLQEQTEALKLGMVTITTVDISRDLSYAKVFVSILEDKKVPDVIKRLNNASKFFRYTLAQAVKLRIAPEIKFVYDDSIVRGSRISSLIHEALKDEQAGEHE